MAKTVSGLTYVKATSGGSAYAPRVSAKLEAEGKVDKAAGKVQIGLKHKL